MFALAKSHARSGRSLSRATFETRLISAAGRQLVRERNGERFFDQRRIRAEGERLGEVLFFFRARRFHSQLNAIFPRRVASPLRMTTANVGRAQIG